MSNAFDTTTAKASRKLAHCQLSCKENIMQSKVTKTIISGALGVAVLAGCASPTKPVASASAQVQQGTVASIDPASIADVPANYLSSGSSGAVTTADTGKVLTIVNFADGTQGRYLTDSPPAYKVGDQIQVVNKGNDILFMRH
jgi:hypothetical protein